MRSAGQSLVMCALERAAEAHQGQWRDGVPPLPYLHHPLEVLHNLVVVGGIPDEELMAVALLHDVVESSGVDLGELVLEFGLRVASLVQELTRTEPEEDQLVGLNPGEVWQLRAEMLLEDIQKMSPDAMLVKLADRLSNLQEALVYKKGKKLERYQWQTDRILKIIPRSVNPKLWDALQAMNKRVGRKPKPD